MKIDDELNKLHQQIEDRDLKIEIEKRQKEVEEQKEMVCYTVATGNLPMPPFIPKKSKQAIEFIKGLDGFIGFNPCYPHGTLCLFRTENDAKVARNMMNDKGIQTGCNICEVYVDTRYLEGGAK